MIQQSTELELSKCVGKLLEPPVVAQDNCSTLFMEEHYTDLRAQASFLTHE